MTEMKKRSSWTNRVDGLTISDSAEPKKVRRPLYKEPFTPEKEGELLFFSATAYAEMSATVLPLLIQLKSLKLENWRCARKRSGTSLQKLGIKNKKFKIQNQKLKIQN